MIKKTLSVLLLVILAAMAAMPALAVQETIDLAAMSMDELRALQLRVTYAMWSSDAWQSVEVPVGAYEVGVEIPAGKWTLTPRAGEYATVTVTDKLNASRTDRARDGQFLAYQVLADKGSFMHESYPTESYTVTLADGMFIIISDAPVIFTPDAGPSFVFK